MSGRVSKRHGDTDWVAAGAVAVRDGLGKMWGRNAATVAVLGLSGSLVEGSEILNPSELQNSYNMGANIPGAVWVSGSYDGNSYYFSGTIIGEEVNTSGNVLETYIAMPMHAGAGVPGATITGAGTGNAVSQNGVTFSSLTPIYESSLWNAGNPWGNAGDLAIFESPTAAPAGSISSLAAPGSLQVGGTVTSVGYGAPSTPNGTLPSTGNPMGFNALISSSVPINAQNGNYFSGFMASPYGIPVNGAGNGGDSGDIALNSSGQIIGMLVGGTGGPTDLERTTLFGVCSTICG